MPDPQKSPLSVRARLAVALVGSAALVGLAAKKTHDYAAAPEGEKECDFVLSPDIVSPDIPASRTGSVRYAQEGGTINDASCLEKTRIDGVVRVSSERDLSDAIKFARANDLRIAASGERHSMGGQAFTHEALVLDMRWLRGMSLDAQHRVLTVESGASWADVQAFLDPLGLSVRAMQSINIFTVGGTLSVNAHGIAHDPGPVASTVRSLRVMLADGRVVAASRDEHPEIFRRALGGYGLFGVILSADIEVTDNELYTREITYMGVADFADFYERRIKDDPNIGLFYGRLSVSPGSYLAEASARVYTRAPAVDPIPPLAAEWDGTIERFIINLSKRGPAGRWLRWTLERYVEPLVHTCTSRNAAMARTHDCVVTRNQEMYDSMKYLKNRLRDTDILQEYFLPPERMAEFAEGLRRIVRERGANLLNVTVRAVRRDDTTSLPYAKGDYLGFVLYFNQSLDRADSEILRATTVDLIDEVARLGGTFYLPYQLHYSPEQLRRAYPEIDDFFAAKRRLDPGELFVNKFYEKYGRSS